MTKLPKGGAFAKIAHGKAAAELADYFGCSRSHIYKIARIRE